MQWKVSVRFKWNEDIIGMVQIAADEYQAVGYNTEWNDEGDWTIFCSFDSEEAAAKFARECEQLNVDMESVLDE